MTRREGDKEIRMIGKRNEIADFKLQISDCRLKRIKGDKR